MKIENVNVLLGDSFVCADVLFEDKIQKIIPRESLKPQGYLIPGLVDIHTHGRMGADFSDGTEEGLQTLSRAYAECGVTSFLATTMSVSELALMNAMAAVRGFKRKGGAKCAGVHLEGPFLSEKKRGAHAEQFLRDPDVALFHRLNDECGGMVKMITVAPERRGAPDFIREVAKSAVVSLGHTAADYELAMKAFECGASHVTHLFNAMEPFLHRSPNLVGAAMDSGASVELICDGLHIHPAVMRAAFALFGERVNLISDSIRCSGMREGEDELGGSPVFVKEGKVTLFDGTLAGSSISLLEGVRRAVKFGVPLEKAVYAATTAPALAAKLDAGKIEVGESSDLVLLNDSLEISSIYVDGEKIV